MALGRQSLQHDDVAGAQVGEASGHAVSHPQDVMQFVDDDRSGVDPRFDPEGRARLVDADLASLRPIGSAAHARLGVHALCQEHDDARALDTQVPAQSRNAVVDAAPDIGLQRGRQRSRGVEEGDFDGHGAGSVPSALEGLPNRSSILSSSPGGSR